MTYIKGSFGTFSVNNIKTAREFYSKLDGLKINEVKGMDSILQIETEDGSRCVIYEKPDHEPASFTVYNLIVESVEKAVADFKKKGITFEKYSRPGLNTDGQGILRDGNVVAAWFKDPAGNIVSVMELKY